MAKIKKTDPTKWGKDVEELELCGISEARLEGRFGSTWMLIDFGEIIVHIFNQESRDFYHLDHLMGEEQKIPLVFPED